ncbi:hypothetical protein K461DRAFT_319866, partial [Myriangium duriaei CBS 260.36]
MSSSNSSLELWYWSPITDSDQTGAGWIVANTLFSFVTISTFARLYLNRRALNPDDYLIATSLLLFIAQNTTLFTALHHGLGKDGATLSSIQQKAVLQISFASDVLAMSSHYLAKSSTAILIYRLFRGDKARLNSICCRSLIGSVFGAAVVSLLLLVAESGEGSRTRGQSSNSISSWEAIVSLDCLTEIALAAVPLFLVTMILRLSKKNFVVWLVFTARLPICAFSVLHLIRRLATAKSNAGPQLLHCEMI